jgi:hypothetical protein
MHRTFLITPFAILIGILLGITASSVIAWSNPTDTPPDGNVSGSPITTGNWQSKLQGLVLNNGTNPTAYGLNVVNGVVSIGNDGTGTVPAIPTPLATDGQGLLVMGKVAANEYCNNDGTECYALDQIIPPSCNTSQKIQWYCPTSGGCYWRCINDSTGTSSGPPTTSATTHTGPERYQGSTNTDVVSSVSCPPGKTIVNCEARVHLVAGYCSWVPTTKWADWSAGGNDGVVDQACMGPDMYESFSYRPVISRNTCTATLKNPLKIYTWDGVQARATCQ